MKCMQPTTVAAIGAAQAGPVLPAFEVHEDSSDNLAGVFPREDPSPGWRCPPA